MSSPIDWSNAHLAAGRLTTNLRLFSDPHERSFLTRLVNRGILGYLEAALGLMSVLLMLAPGSPSIARGVTLLQLFGNIGLFLSVTLIFRVVLNILSPGRTR
jgi:ubiquinone biosynthesis protein